MRKLLIAAIIMFLPFNALAQEKPLEEIKVEGRKTNLVGEAVSASEGVVGQQEIDIRPILRTGEVLELVPGMVVTQHSGSGKANQYFLRGFNLDHGTDFSTYVDGMPVNMRSHGHGQGYTDLNFLIPETVASLDYQKGAYYADIGDFSGAGGVNIMTMKSPETDIVSLSVGEDNYRRALLMAGLQHENSKSLFAFEANRYDGPWRDVSEDIGKNNLLIKHSGAIAVADYSIALMAYENRWNSADQIPARAVNLGIIDALGSIDNTAGGESSRYSVSANWATKSWNGFAYYIGYDLNLWSNFTYFLDDETNGDQFEQVDKRSVYGGELEYAFESSVADKSLKNRFGAQFRVDDISEVGLYKTVRRERLGVTRSDDINQHSLSLYWENEIAWNQHLRSVIGARYDHLSFRVRDRVGINQFGVNLTQNGGEASDNLISAKGSLVYDFNDFWEGYLSMGQGFHSNDARGTTIVVDPNSGAAVERVDPLVRSTGYELGLRGVVSDKLNTSLALWSLQLDSELLFVGDAGNTEASQPSIRKGLEIVAYYYLNDKVSFDLEYALSDAKFRGDVANGNNIPGAVKEVIQAGVNLDMGESWFGSLRYRYFGGRPLTENGTQESDSTSIWNLRVGYEFPRWRLMCDVLNITNSDDHDIDYFYESRLFNEPEGSSVEDIHYHPIEPRTVRVTLEYKF